MTAKERLKQIRDAFNAAIAPILAAAPTPAPVAPVGSPTPFKLQDGSDITIVIDDPATSALPDAGDAVIIAGTPAAAGSYTLADGTVIVVDATGIISAVTPPTAVDPNTVPTEMKTPEQMRAFLTKFADDNTPDNTSGMGGTDVQKLALVVKALFEDRFGWDLRRAQEEAQKQQAIEIYKTGFSANQVALTSLMEIVEKLAEQEIGEPTEKTEKAWDDMTPLERYRASKQSTE